MHQRAQIGRIPSHNSQQNPSPSRRKRFLGRRSWDNKLQGNTVYECLNFCWYVTRYQGYNKDLIDRFVNMGFDIDRVVEAFNYVNIDRNNGEDYELEEAYMGDITARLLGEPWHTFVTWAWGWESLLAM